MADTLRITWQNWKRIIQQNKLATESRKGQSENYYGPETLCYKIRKRRKKGEERERKAGKCKREAERGSWGRKTRKIDGETLKGRGKGKGEEADVKGRGKRKGAVGVLIRGRGSKKDLGSRNAEGEMEVNKEMGVGMRKWVREVNKEMDSGNAEGGKRRKKE
jgi:hypothetical protein